MLSNFNHSRQTENASNVHYAFTNSYKELRMDKLMKINEVENTVGFRKSTIYSRISEGGFPPPVRIGRSNRWLASDVSGWIEEKAGQRSKE